jgi:hypothetical protein
MLKNAFACMPDANVHVALCLTPAVCGIGSISADGLDVLFTYTVAPGDSTPAGTTLDYLSSLSLTGQVRNTSCTDDWRSFRLLLAGAVHHPAVRSLWSFGAFSHQQLWLLHLRRCR